MCILLNVKKHEKTFALNVDIFRKKFIWITCWICFEKCAKITCYLEQRRDTGE